MTCSLHVLNSKVHDRVGGIENSIQSALKFIEINLDLPLTCSYETMFSFYHVIVNSLCLNQIIHELFMNLF